MANINSATEGESMMVSGLIFRDIANQPDHTHVGAWRDDDGLITVAYLGIFPKQTRVMGVEIGGMQQSAESIANGLLVQLMRKA
jgi:hypothetical protein